MRKLFLIALLAVAVAAASFTFPAQSTSPEKKSSALLIPDNFVGRCEVCNDDELCGIFRVFVESANSTVVISVYDVLNNASYPASGTFSWNGGTRWVSGLSFTSAVLGSVGYSGPLTYTW